MIGLAVKTAAAVFALWGLALWAMDRREKRTDGVSRQWINYLADRSRKREKADVRTRGRYSKAGILNHVYRAT